MFAASPLSATGFNFYTSSVTGNVGNFVMAGSTLSASAYRINGANALTFTPDDTTQKIGYGAAPNSSASYETFIGWNSGNIRTAGGGSVCVGAKSCYSLVNGGPVTAVGVEAGQSAGSSNGTYFGYRAGFLDTHIFNTLVGHEAGYYVGASGGGYNTALGAFALHADGGIAGWGTGTRNAAVGHYSSYAADGGSYNASLGAEALINNQAGNYNAAVGYQAGNGVANISYSSNTFIGAQTGYSIATGGNGNTLLGYQAGYTLATGSNNLLLGARVDVPSAATNNYLNIGNVITGDLATSSVTVRNTLTASLNLNIATTSAIGYGVNVGTPVYFSNDGEFWSDIRTPLLSSNAGGSVPPVVTRFRRDTAGTSQGVFAYAFQDQSNVNNEQELYFTIQMPHSWKTGTAIKPHLHYSVASASTPVTDDTIVFGLEYTCDGAETPYPVTGLSKSTSTAPTSFGGGYAVFPDLTPPSVLSALCLFRIYRNSSSTVDNFAHAVFGIEMDFHYLSDSLGSRQELIK